MFKKSSIFILLGSLICSAALAQQAAGRGDNDIHQQADSLSAKAVAGFHLRGILITQSSRAAMLNGKILREGDSLDGAEILAIDERNVRIRIGSSEQILVVGSTVVAGQSSQPALHIVRNGRQTRPIAERTRRTTTDPDQVAIQAESDALEHLHTVRQGETLSGIAENYLSGNTTRNQVAIALFEANPKAFRGNINALRAGAVLRIPSEQVLQRQAPVTATAAVVAQTATWRSSVTQPIKVAATPGERRYGPVDYGETLSAIAERTLRDGFTLDQMMIALFEANPRAFDGNINALHEGAILRIPGESELMRRAGGSAAAEVVAQTIAWRNSSLRQARSDDVLSQVTASNNASTSASTGSSMHAFIPPFE